MLNVIELDFDYQEHPLLNQINFQLAQGGLLHLKGGNGAGKTTLLKLISGLYQPVTGQIEFGGENIAQHLKSYQQQICFVGHKTGLNLHLTIQENCLFDVHYQETAKDIAELAQVFQLQAHLNTPCGLLSAGQKKQVSLMRLWMTKAKLWLLDEPLVALDERAISILMEYIQQHRMHGGAVLLTSHQALPLPASHYQEYHL